MKKFLWAIFLAVLFFRICLVMQLEPHHQVDTCWYLSGPNCIRPMGWWICAFFPWLFGGMEGIAVGNVLFGAGAFLLLWKVCPLAAILYWLDPAILQCESKILSESYFTACLVAGVLLTEQPFLRGSILGLAVVIRQQAVFLPLLFIRKDIYSWSIFTPVCIFVVVQTSLFGNPFTLGESAQFYTRTSRVLAQLEGEHDMKEFYPKLGARIGDENYYESPSYQKRYQRPWKELSWNEDIRATMRSMNREILLQHPLISLQLMARGVHQMLKFPLYAGMPDFLRYLWYEYLYLIYALALFAVWKFRKEELTWICVGIILYHISTTVYSVGNQVQGRYRVPMMPFMYLLAGKGVMHLWTNRHAA